MDVQFLVKHQVKNDKLRDTPDNVQHTSTISTLSMVSCGFHSSVRTAFDRSVFSLNDHASHRPQSFTRSLVTLKKSYLDKIVVAEAIAAQTSDQRVDTFSNKAISSKNECTSSEVYAHPLIVVFVSDKAAHPCGIDRHDYNSLCDNDQVEKEHLGIKFRTFKSADHFICLSVHFPHVREYFFYLLFNMCKILNQSIASNL